MTRRSARPDLEDLAAAQLGDLLHRVPIGALLPVIPYPAAFTTLEFLMTAILRTTHREWIHEDIDGLDVSVARRSGKASVTLIGTCILITDQTVTPFTLSADVGEQGSIAELHLRLGEPGGGQLGISGPPYGSSAASTLRMMLPARIDEVDWSYSVRG